MQLQEGFHLTDGASGVCRAEKEDVILVFANGQEIRGLDLQKREEFDVIAAEKRIEALDYDAQQQIVFWADSYDKTIKRSYMVNAIDGRAKIGFAQDLNMKEGPSPQPWPWTGWPRISTGPRWTGRARSRGVA